MTAPIGIAGIVRTDTKQTDLTVAQYDGLARPGEIIVDLATYNVFVGNLSGNLTQINNVATVVSNISNGNSILDISLPNGNIIANVAGLGNVLDIGSDVVVIAGNLIPASNSVYTLGNATNQWKDMWISGSTIYIDGVPVSSDGTQLLINGVPVLTQTPTGNTNVSNLNATGNINGGGNLNVAGNGTIGGTLTVGGNITSSGDIITTGNVSGSNITTSGNITSAGNISTGGNLVAAGNVTGMNFNASGNMTAGGNITAVGGLITDTVTSLTGALTLSAIGVNQPIVLNPSGTGNIDVVNSYVTNLLDPVQPQDGATKAYVDNLAQGILPKAPCDCGTPASLQAITGGTVTYNNGTSGVGATLTLSVPMTSLDGVVLSPGMRVLVYNQTPALQNGVYTYTSSTVLTRATDSDTAAELQSGSFVFITGGTTLISSGFTIITEPVVMGTDPIQWAQFSGAGSYTAGAGLSLTGSQFSVSDVGVTPGTYGGPGNLVSVTVNGKGQITAIANTGIGPVANFSVTNTLTASNVNVSTSLFSVGPIQTLGAISASNITATGNALVQGNVLATGNITVQRSAVIQGNLRVGNVDVIGNLNVSNLNITGNSTISGPSTFNGNVTYYGSTTFNTINNLRIGGGTSGQVLTTYGNGRVYWSSPTNLGNVNIAGNLLVGGQLMANAAWDGSTQPAFWAAGCGVQPPYQGSVRAVNFGSYVTGGVDIGAYPGGSGTSGAIYARRYNSTNDWNVPGKSNLFEVDWIWRKSSATPGSGWIAMCPAGNSPVTTFSGDGQAIGAPLDGIVWGLRINPATNAASTMQIFNGNSSIIGSGQKYPMSADWATDGRPHTMSILSYKPTDNSTTGGYVALYIDGKLFTLMNWPASGYWWGGESGASPYAMVSYNSETIFNYMTIQRFYSGSGQQFVYNLGNWPHLTNMPS